MQIVYMHLKIICSVSGPSTHSADLQACTRCLLLVALAIRARPTPNRRNASTALACKT